MLKKQFIQRLGLIFRQVGGMKLCMLTLMCCLLASSVAFAQSSNSKNSSQSSSQKIVMYSGVVVDNEDLPLVGVNVVVKGSKPIIGTTTDIDGNFKISMPQGKFTLEFSYVGMKTQEVYVQNTNKLKVRLEEDATMLEQLVVTGIYRRNTESFTGSAVTYSSEKIKEAGNQNILQGLSLIDPSFSILENTLMGSDPNSLAEININGTISINGLTDTYASNPDQPLFILDGFETTLARISDMSMDRIESITILKDAASTAIYGAKAANGVIVVETKKPEAGKLRFSYNGNFQVG
ncbi:MAG: carboxypeptidase-like regulatory domain-containing protein [Bacteroidales bacterium]|nr:carboxypeptidase-like regulatory domain-containing protein [Bacteroidales bacterium]